MHSHTRTGSAPPDKRDALTAFQQEKLFLGEIDQCCVDAFYLTRESARLLAALRTAAQQLDAVRPFELHKQNSLA